MTRYKITYTLKGSSEEITGSIVERDECRAKKYLRSLAREKGNTVETIKSVTVDVENVPASKQQERDALAEIKAIVESLGEQSYLATAFDGCFEDAENNIDDDAAYSMKDRWESALNESYRQGNIITDLRQKLNILELDSRDLRLAIDRVKQEAADAEQQLREKTLSDDDMADAQELVAEVIAETEAAVTAAAETIVKYAQSPASTEFQQAVTDHRAMSSKLDYYKALKDRIIAARQAGA